MSGFKIKIRHSGFTLTEVAIGLGILGLLLTGIWEAAHSVYQNNKIKECETQWGLLANSLEQMYMSGLLGLPSATGNNNLPSSSLMIGSSGWYYAGIINDMVAAAQWAPLSMIDQTQVPPVLINPWSSQTSTSTNGVTSLTADGVLVTLGTLTSGGLTIPANDPNAMSQYAAQNCGNVQNQSCIPTAAGNDSFEIAFNNIPVYACIALAMHFGGDERPQEIISIFIGINNWKAGGGIGMGGQSPLPITLAQATTMCNQSANGYNGTSPVGTSFIDVVYQP